MGWLYDEINARGFGSPPMGPQGSELLKWPNERKSEWVSLLLKCSAFPSFSLSNTGQEAQLIHSVIGIVRLILWVSWLLWIPSIESLGAPEKGGQQRPAMASFRAVLSSFQNGKRRCLRDWRGVLFMSDTQTQLWNSGLLAQMLVQGTEQADGNWGAVFSVACRVFWSQSSEKKSRPIALGRSRGSFQQGINPLAETASQWHTACRTPCLAVPLADTGSQLSVWTH